MSESQELTTHGFTPVSADDPLFGGITGELDHENGSLAVHGGGDVPRVEIRRAAGAPLETHVPIGTRDPERLTMTVGGESVSLRPAKGFLTRRSYRVDAGPERQGGGRHRLVPAGVHTSRLLRDGRLLGEFASTGDGKVSAEWKPGTTPEPRDAAIGYALAAAFGTGAEPMWRLILDALLDLWP
ncbi:hypothetical protein [Streptomyces sp. NPDC052012]|uniref:hypothetical protein n=1 Tax=Streptomyces sp. NPDC052012 TaxID=3155051 RepID=UPI00344DB59C